MSTPSATSVAQTLADNLHQIRSQILQLDAEALARQSGFLKRKPRKVVMPDFLLALVSLAAEATLSLERIASVISLVAHKSYSKQALSKRLNSSVERFLARVAANLFANLSDGPRSQGLFGHFRRVLLHDSTVQALPEKLAGPFPGGRNQCPQKRASLKIQFVADILNATLVQCSLSGYTRNDQAASADILEVARPGDLIMRDLGYFCLLVMNMIASMGAFFLSRYKHGVKVCDLEKRPLDLARELRTYGRLDREVLLGSNYEPARLVATPVPDAVANERRRKARANHDGRYQPSKESLFLMGWNIFITNVSRQTWPAKSLLSLYRLRWRIEMVFKAWKSHLGFREFNARSESLLRLSVMVKLLFCVLVHHFCDALELLGEGQQHVSLLRLARIIGQCACLFAVAVLDITPNQWLEHQLKHHLYYEKREDRRNYFELLAEAGFALG